MLWRSQLSSTIASKSSDSRAAELSHCETWDNKSPVLKAIYASAIPLEFHWGIPLANSTGPRVPSGILEGSCLHERGAPGQPFLHAVARTARGRAPPYFLFLCVCVYFRCVSVFVGVCLCVFVCLCVCGSARSPLLALDGRISTRAPRRFKILLF